jgi:hypothetical protein
MLTGNDFEFHRMKNMVINDKFKSCGKNWEQKWFLITKGMFLSFWKQRKSNLLSKGYKNSPEVH